MIQPYTKLYAQLYDRLFTASQNEIDFYRYFLLSAGRETSCDKKIRALECACGTGNILLECMREQKNVEIDGLDCSQEMLDLCAQKINSGNIPAGLKSSINLYCASMHNFSRHDFKIDRLYDVIYIPACSFMLLTDYVSARQALANFYKHLAPGGQLLISLFLPFNEMSCSNRAARLWKDVIVSENNSCLENNSGLESSARALVRVLVYETLRYRPLEQLRTGLYRFETYRDGCLQATQLHELTWRWYGAHEFRLMLEAARFREITLYGDHTLEPAGNHDETIVFRAIK